MALRKKPQKQVVFELSKKALPNPTPQSWLDRLLGLRRIPLLTSAKDK